MEVFNVYSWEKHLFLWAMASIAPNPRTQRFFQVTEIFFQTQQAGCLLCVGTNFAIKIPGNVCINPMKNHDFGWQKYLSGWWFEPTPLKNDGVKVSWDDYSIPSMWKNKIHVPNHLNQ